MTPISSLINPYPIFGNEKEKKMVDTYFGMVQKESTVKLNIDKIFNSF
jgi:hypothetical protein